MSHVNAGRFVRRLFLMVIPGALIFVTGCSRTIDMAAVNKSIVDGLAGQLGMTGAVVSCPTESKTLKAGDTFECTAKPKEGGRLVITVTEKDDQGQITWLVTKTEGLIDLRVVEESVKGGLKSQVGVDATVSCGGRWLATKAGATHECQAKSADGKDIPIVVTMTDDAGNISWATK